MKSKFTLVWFGISVVLAVVLARELRNSSARQEKLEVLQKQVEELDGKVKEARALAEKTDEDRRRLQVRLQAAELDASAGPSIAEARAIKASTGTEAKPSNGSEVAQKEEGAAGGEMGKMLANMMKDPDMRKAMEQQQRVAMDMLYGSLLKKLQLTPEVEKQFKDLLLDQQMSSISQASELMNSSNRVEAAMQIREAHEKRQGAFKELLGEEGYSQFEKYNQTVGERMMLEQMGGKSLGLQPEQTDQLISIIGEEKRNIQINQGGAPFDPNTDIQGVLEGNRMEEYFSQQELVNQRVLERAGQLLTPEQLRELEPMLKNQLQMQRAGMKMARQMFGGAENSEAPPAGSQE